MRYTDTCGLLMPDQNRSKQMVHVVMKYVLYRAYLKVLFD